MKSMNRRIRQDAEERCPDHKCRKSLAVELPKNDVVSKGIRQVGIRASMELAGVRYAFALESNPDERKQPVFID